MIPELLSQPNISHLFKCDASNGYWAVPIHPAHYYKTGFACHLGQYCYLKMGQGLTGGAGTYARLKDLAMGNIPEPNSEPALADVDEEETVFLHFMDDDVGGASSFDRLLGFLHYHYFPRVAWAKLTLNPKKSVFFCNRFKILGNQRCPQGIRPSEDKLAMFRDYPVPTCTTDVEKFCYMLQFLEGYIPGRADW